MDIEVSMEWLDELDAEAVQPPARANTEDAEKAEPSGTAATIQALAAGDLDSAVHAKQAAED